MKHFKPKKRLSAQAYIEGVLSGNRVLLSRAITIIESNLESDKLLAKEIIQVQNRITHDLSWPVIGNIATTIDFKEGRTFGFELFFG